MPKVALTAEQKRYQANADMGRSLMNALNARRGLLGLSKKEFAELIGVCPDTLANWNNTDLRNASLWSVLDALQRSGAKVEIRADVGI